MSVLRSIDWQFDKSRNVAAIQCYGSSTPWFVYSLCGNGCVETGRVHGCTSTPPNVHLTQPNNSNNGAKRSLRPLSVLNTIKKFNSRRKAQPRAFICIQRIIIRFWLPHLIYPCFFVIPFSDSISKLTHHGANTSTLRITNGIDIYNHNHTLNTLDTIGTYSHNRKMDQMQWIHGSRFYCTVQHINTNITQ